MKRRTKDKVGDWPNMRDDTLRAICDELIRARKLHPDRANNLRMLRISFEALDTELLGNNIGKMSAVQIYARAAQVAAMAIRILEEGSVGYKYHGNTVAPPFKLKSEDDLHGC
jgi:hypothetical protein